ncbi:MAG: DUF3604 domain-containing protein [Candidatus Helarchaeota archaeon]
MGGIKVVFRVATDQSPLQFHNQKGIGYVSAEASNGASVILSYNSAGSTRPWYKTLYVRIAGNYMKEGDTLTIYFGDKRFGSPGFKLQTFCEDTFEFRVFVDLFSTNEYIQLQHSPEISIIPGPPRKWKAILPTLREPKEIFNMFIIPEDKWGNPSNKANEEIFLIPNFDIINLPQKILIKPGQFGVVIKNLSSQDEGILRIDVYNKDMELLTRSNQMALVRNLKYRHYWGDLHGQSEETIGTNSAKSYFEFARNKAFLDIVGHQGNDFQIDESFWAELNRLNAIYNEPGHFITIPGYEWSGNTAVGGDRNIWYYKEMCPILHSSYIQIPDDSYKDYLCITAKELFNILSKYHENVVVSAHAGGRFSDIKTYHDGKIEHSIEIHSSWGTFEWLLHDAFKMGYRIGIIANSDDHKGRPGASYPGRSIFGSYGGLTCFLMEYLNRKSLFEAIKRRHHYATTGERIFLKIFTNFNSESTLFERDPNYFNCKGIPTRKAIIGDIIQTKENEVLLLIEILGTAPIERVEIFNGLELIETIHPYTQNDLGNRIRVIWSGAEFRGRRRNVHWKGSVHLINNTIKKFRPINFWNVDAPLQCKNKNELLWHVVTSGNFVGFDIWLEDKKNGKINFESNQISFEIPISKIDYNDICYNIGGIEKKVVIFRLPDTNHHNQINITRKIPIKQNGDTKLYIRVTQEDGHRAWSSPIYIFK